MSHPYRALLRASQVRPALLAVFLSAVPLGVSNLAIILSVEQWTGSLGLAGWLAGLFTVGNAVGLAVQGRLIDRIGARKVIAGSGFTSAVALVLLVLLGYSGAPPAVLALAVGLAGVAVPAITTAVRAWLPSQLAEGVRIAGYALLGVLFQVAVTVGPLLVSLAVLVGAAPLALLAAAAILVLAVAVFVSRVNLTRSSTSTADCTATPGSRGLAAVLVVAACAGLASGITAVALPGITTAAGRPVMAGVLFSVLAAGEMAGALAYGGRRWRLSLWAQLGVVFAAAAAVAAAAYPVSVAVVLLVPVMLFAGVLSAPMAIALSALLDEAVPASRLGQAYSLLVSVGLVAVATGNAMAGSLAAVLTARQLLIGPPLALLVAAALTVVRLRHGTAPVTSSPAP